MVTFELANNATLTSKERGMLTEARKMPVVYDSDSPELSDEMEKAFVAARETRPYHGEPLAPAEHAGPVAGQAGCRA